MLGALRRRNSAYAYMGDAEAMKPQVARALGDIALANVSYSTVTASRAQIARAAGPLPTIHEQAFDFAEGKDGEGELH